jgi:hypothetical protein
VIVGRDVPQGARFDMANIPQHFQHLDLRIIAKTANSGGSQWESVQFNFNGDSTSNYSYVATDYNDAYSTTAEAVFRVQSESAPFLGYVASSHASNIAGRYGTIMATIFGYSSAFWTKHAISHSYAHPQNANGSPYKSDLYISWKSTDPITRITFFSGAAAFAAGSQFDLYGLP